MSLWQATLGLLFPKKEDLLVSNILLDVVPDEDGNPVEVYAKSVDEVVDRLTALSNEIEELKAQPEATAPAQSSYYDAYYGAYEDMQIWKRRALEAEEACRRLTAVLNAENGQTHMGELVVTAPTSTQHSCPCGYGDKPCPGPDGKLLCAKG